MKSIFFNFVWFPSEIWDKIESLFEFYGLDCKHFYTTFGSMSINIAFASSLQS
jgi:hypothetical protein